jgi:small GTP-binding protein
MSEDSEKDDDTEVKVVLVGNSGVGKTRLVNVVLSGSSRRDEVRPTIGASFSTKSYEYHNRTVLFQIWDTAGNERFRAMTPLYYRDARIVLFVFAVDDVQSFDQVDSWHQGVADALGRGATAVLIGNKLDGIRIVPRHDAERKAADLGAHYIETSALTGVGLDQLLDMMAELAVKDFNAG